MKNKYILCVLALLFSTLTSAVDTTAAVSDDFTTSLAWDNGRFPDQWRVDALTQESKIKILWWNTGCGLLNRIMIKEKNKPDSLYSNIDTIASSANPPDILILGEHCPGQIPQKTKSILARVYGHDYNLEYSNKYENTRNGIWVFSKWPLERVRKASMEVGETQARKEKTARTYLLFKVKSPELDFYLSPVHIYNVWREMSYPEVVLFSPGTGNANYDQIALHLKMLQEDLDLSRDPVIVVGDFNSAKNFLPFVSMGGYNLYAQNLVDVGVNESTFPSQSSKDLGNGYPDIQIDHIFTNEFRDGKSVMLPLKGSDHYPILFNY